MTAATETKPTTTDTDHDDRVRHYVERLSPNGVIPPTYSKTALCGAKVEVLVDDDGNLLGDHNGTICQGCVDEARRRPVEG